MYAMSESNSTYHPSSSQQAAHILYSQQGGGGTQIPNLGWGRGGVLGPEIRYFDPWENGQKRQLRIQIEQGVPSCRLPFSSLFSPSCLPHLSLPQVRLSHYKQLGVVTS